MGSGTDCRRTKKRKESGDTTPERLSPVKSIPMKWKTDMGGQENPRNDRCRRKGP